MVTPNEIAFRLKCAKNRKRVINSFWNRLQAAPSERIDVTRNIRFSFLRGYFMRANINAARCIKVIVLYM